MTQAMHDAARFGVNTYSYMFSQTALEAVHALSVRGYGGVELMLYPGHLWPDLDAGAIATLRKAAAQASVPILELNMPNIDVNVAAAAAGMRSYSLNLLERFLELGGELGARALVIGPGKANPLYPAPAEELLGHFFRALDRLIPRARTAGVQLLVENMPFAFLPDAFSLMAALERHGADGVGVVYDFANAHFIGEDPADALRHVRQRLGLVHYSDTTRTAYRHDPIGRGDVEFSGVAALLAEIGFAGPHVLEVIAAADADRAILESARRLAGLGCGGARPHEIERA
ncbi:MAG: sugar phosphate isomerase/epimerase family protein [Acetobacteraceae bacterium]